VLPTEFEEVQREYPILIRKDPSGDYQAVALLGLDRDENLFLDETGWNARYVPAVQQRGAVLDRPAARRARRRAHADDPCRSRPPAYQSAKASPCSCRRAATRPTCNT
jgi:hypothetical protein